MIWLDLPVPPSTNKIRRIDWKNHAAHKAWQRAAGNAIIAARCRKVDPIRGLRIDGRYELRLILDESVGLDTDATIKAVNDMMKRSLLVRDDSPKYCRRIVIEFGDVPAGIRVILSDHQEMKRESCLIVSRET